MKWSDRRSSKVFRALLRLDFRISDNLTPERDLAADMVAGEVALPSVRLVSAQGYARVARAHCAEQHLRANLQAHSVRELIVLAKTKQLSYGSPGIGNSLPLAIETFNLRAGTQMLHVPYKGAGPVLNALLGNEVQVMFIPPTVAVPHVKAGRLRGLGYSGPKRLEALPDVPTIAEAGLAGFQKPPGWHALFAPAKTPGAIMQKLYTEVREAVQLPRLREYLLAAGFEPAGDPPARFEKDFHADIKRYAELVRAAKIEPQ